jgi:hypothetical protein
MRIAVFTLFSLLALSGCGQNPNASYEQPGDDKAEATEPAAPPTGSTSPKRVDTDRVDLTPYLGKYPFDVVGGYRFLDNPEVKAAIAAAVPDTKQRAKVKFEKNGLGVPIVRVDGGRILVWGGAHRAEDHYNWAVVIAPDGSKPEICIYDGLGYDGDFQSSQWFEPGSPSIMKQGKCPSEDEDYPAAAIAVG